MNISAQLYTLSGNKKQGKKNKDINTRKTLTDTNWGLRVVSKAHSEQSVSKPPLELHCIALLVRLIRTLSLFGSSWSHRHWTENIVSQTLDEQWTIGQHVSNSQRSTTATPGYHKTGPLGSYKLVDYYASFFQKASFAAGLVDVGERQGNGQFLLPS